jgi:choline dehydrogenase-like flavoprotein
VRVAVVGSGFAGSLLARILAVQGHDVMLLERGTHPRFAIGESSTPLANLSLERIARRYGLDDCYALAAHGRWITLAADSTVPTLTDESRTLSIAGVAGQWAFPAADTIAGAKYAARAFRRRVCRTR